MDATVVDDVEILVHKRTPGAGHLTAVLHLDDAVRFADAELAQGRLVILEIGADSIVVRVGKEIADFVRRLFKIGGKVPELTTMARMAGGEDTPVPGTLGIPMPVLPRRYRDEPAGASAGPSRNPTARHESPEAEVRAWRALVDHIGARDAQAMLAGGGVAVRSQLWPGLIYIVAQDIIRVVNQGMLVGRICIVPVDGGSIWDAILSRIQLLQSGADGEAQVFGSGNIIGP